MAGSRNLPRSRLSKRSRIEIYFDVLKAIGNGIRLRTPIMYQSNISWKPLIRILNGLISEGLILDLSAGTGRHFYELTDKGREVLHSFSRVIQSARKIENSYKLTDKGREILHIFKLDTVEKED